MQQYQQHQQQQAQFAQRQWMPEPPSVLSTKDTLYLKDAMSWELIAMKKCNQFAQECMDMDVKQAIHGAGQMHQRHYQMLLQHVTPQKSINSMQ